MPPEVLIGYNESTPKIDIWSLGVILYALIVGTLPFRASSGSLNSREELRKLIIEKEITINHKELGISKECEDLIIKMLKKDPAQRISMSEILEHKWI